MRTCYKCILSIPKSLKWFIKSFVNQRQEQAQREVEQRQAEEAEATGAARWTIHDTIMIAYNQWYNVNIYIELIYIYIYRIDIYIYI